MDQARLRRLSDWNFLLSQGCLFGASETGEVMESRDAVIATCGLPVPLHNWLFPKTPVRDASALVEMARVYFERRKLPFHFSVRDHLETELGAGLEAAGFPAKDAVPCMVLAELPSPRPAATPLEIRSVDTLEDLVAFRETAFEGFGLPLRAAHLFLTEAMLELPNVRFLLGSVNGQPVATSALVATGEVAGIYWVATSEPVRGRGFGAEITWAAVQAGREHACRIASLQASEVGRPVYERMGFAHVGSYRRFGADL